LALTMPLTQEQAGPPERPHIHPHSPGQVVGAIQDFVILPWNDLPAVAQLFAEMGHEIAAVMCEPMMCNTSAILPEPGQLEGLRRLCDQYGVVFYMDETITGFRLGLHGAQGRFGVTPDLASFAKAMGGGIANSALVGRRQYMSRFAHDVNHSGTFNGNVLSMAASAATLAVLEADEGAVYRRMESTGAALMTGMREIADQLGAPLLVQGLPMAFHTSFTELPAIRNYRDYAFYCDKERFSRFCVALLKRGVRVIERGMWYLSAAHTDEHIGKTLSAVEAALRESEPI
jgi:glutamate-1-semialdehyde 2,1-aminomutase